MRKSVNRVLLRVCALRTFGEPAEALILAEDAVISAWSQQAWELLSKAQLYRALCLMDLQKWREARFCLIRAASIRASANIIEGLTSFCTKRIRLSPDEEGDVAFDIIPGL